MTTRRTFIKQSALSIAGSSLLLTCDKKEIQEATSGIMRPFYIGTYTNKESQGIYRALFNTETGEITGLALAAASSNPSFIALHPNSTHLYAVHEVSDYNGEDSGAISAYSLQADGSLALLNTQLTRGGAPCYVSLDAGGQWAFIANYGGGNVTLFPVDADGRVQEATSFIQHEGSSAHPTRQQAPHAHCILIDPTGKYVYSADLGIDKIMIYELDSEQEALIPKAPAQLPAGAGPRHFVFHPNGRHAFVINELNSTITAFDYDNSTSTLTAIATTSTLPADFQDSNTCADIHVHPNGRFVYGSNRGHDSIAVLEFDEETGSLAWLATTSTQGNTPRNFTLDPSGRFLLAANQNSNTILSLSIHPDTGLLAPTGHLLEVPTPVCLKFV